MLNIRVKYDDTVLRENLENADKIYEEMIGFIVDYHAAKGQAAMKANAPWTDRTSAARNGLFTVVEKGNGGYTIIFSHTMHYGFWLEVKFSGRDAIIMPTVKSQGHALMSDLRERFG